MKNFYARLVDKLDQNESFVLATIIETKGSSPQVPGASAVFSSEGLLTGTLGGGWLEASAQTKAFEALEKREALLCEFSLNADIHSNEGAICGGEIQILLDPCPEKHRDTFEKIVRSLGGRKSGVLATFFSRVTGEKVELERYWIEKNRKFIAFSEKPFSLYQSEIEKVSSADKPGLLKIKAGDATVEREESFLFLEPVSPFPQLVIAGAGHIGRVLSHIGSLLNFEVTVLDSRPEFANKQNLPDADSIIVDKIEHALKNYPVSHDTYIVLVTPGHQQDAEALRQVIASEAAYIGMIGSKRKIALMRKSFLDQGWATDVQFDRIHAPIGIEINSKTVEEIAISIAAQLVLVRSESKNKNKDSI